MREQPGITQLTRLLRFRSQGMPSYAREYARVSAYRCPRRECGHDRRQDLRWLTRGLMPLQGKKNVEVRPAHTNKGEIVQRLLYQYADTEFCMCAGDDKTDEDMFHSMARIFSTATPGPSGCAPTIAPPESLKLFPSLAGGTGLPPAEQAQPVESKLDPSAMYMIAIEAREVSLMYRLSALSRADLPSSCCSRKAPG